MKPGEIIFADGDILLNEGLKIIELTVRNDASYLIAVSSHFHFYDVNKALVFDREKTKDFRLNIPTGGWVFFEPMKEKTVELVSYAGARKQEEVCNA